MSLPPLVDIEVDIIRNITKAEILDFYNKFIDPASHTRSKASVHMHAAAAAGAPKPNHNDAIIGKICEYISTYSGTETDPVVISKALSAVDPAEPESAMSGFLQCLTQDLEISPETAQSIVQEGAAILTTFLPSLVKVNAPLQEEEEEEEEIGDQGEVIEDIRAYKARLQLTKGAMPVRPLVEFEESSAKL